MDVPISLQHRREAAKFLLGMSTGPFASDTIYHHCRFGCCKSIKETKLKMWCAIQVILVAFGCMFAIVLNFQSSKFKTNQCWEVFPCLTSEEEQICCFFG